MDVISVNLVVKTHVLIVFKDFVMIVKMVMNYNHLNVNPFVEMDCSKIMNNVIFKISNPK